MQFDQEARIAFNTPAKIANRFSGTAFNTGMIRLAFAEAAPGEDKAFVFHSAIMMSSSDTDALLELLQKLKGNQ